MANPLKVAGTVIKHAARKTRASRAAEYPRRMNGHNPNVKIGSGSEQMVQPYRHYGTAYGGWKTQKSKSASLNHAPMNDKTGRRAYSLSADTHSRQGKAQRYLQSKGKK